MLVFLPNNIYLLLVCACFLSCGDGGYADSKQNRNSPSDVKKELPNNQDGELDGLYTWIKKNAFELGLNSLELGYDSLQFRIWLGHSMAVKRHLVILELNNNRWRGQLITFTQSDNSIIQKNDTRVTPHSGWRQFEKKLNDLHIIQSLTEQDLNRHDGCGGADGMNYYFEIATINRYWFLYHCYPDDAIIQFTNYLEKEFDFEFTKE